MSNRYESQINRTNGESFFQKLKRMVHGRRRAEEKSSLADHPQVPQIDKLSVEWRDDLQHLINADPIMQNSIREAYEFLESRGRLKSQQKSSQPDSAPIPQSSSNLNNSRRREASNPSYPHLSQPSVEQMAAAQYAQGQRDRDIKGYLEQHHTNPLTPSLITQRDIDERRALEDRNSYGSWTDGAGGPNFARDRALFSPFSYGYREPDQTDHNPPSPGGVNFGPVPPLPYIPHP